MREVDSSYHVQTIIWGIRVHSIDKGGLLFLSTLYILKGYEIF